MPAGTSPLAITEVGYTNATKIEVEKKLSEAEPLLTSADEFESGHAFDPIYEIACEGKGDLPDGLAAGDAPDGEDFGIVGGKTLVEQTTEVEHNETWNDWKFNAKNFPAAA